MGCMGYVVVLVVLGFFELLGCLGCLVDVDFFASHFNRIHR